nr:CMF_HP1_G0042470.mRNA.1.CDS.1 [Saccharomyces cerevisiae]
MANFTRTTYDIGMLFSCQVGVQYCAERYGKFEALIARGKNEWDTIQSRPRYSTSDDELKSFIETDFYKSFLDAEQSADYSNTGDNSKKFISRR